ncbi:beta-glucoside-specific PTS transporter subunit IIABC [Saccharibacillus brassicae]|uniref:PTS beta-glucoside transporter subunit IIBCA n=1 Tax=Saccharibacillus brassicae TaxID=2583377 RepID=A0A4Y6UXA2_SACBS|nr:beta-glucoside-specific PTS transporter subunit IIABC [Saccharibacillus brassicae]QDH22359.1 PTS beta-glucoside transporter subunit IIBCA [Saccharibacillus brassicae]
MDHTQLASEILRQVGGTSNVVHLGHCATRLRFTLADDSKPDVEALKKVPGVLSVVKGAQFQVVVGNQVIEVFDEMQKLGDFGGDSRSAASSVQAPRPNGKKAGAVLLDFLVGVFQPLIPAMAGAGILKSLLLLLATFGWVDKTGQTYLILTFISGSVFYFLPILVALTVAAKLRVNHIVAAAAMSVLLFPDMTKMMTEGAQFLSFSITNVNYASQVFPSILGVLFYAYMEKLFTRISPKPIRVFFIPMMSLLLTVPFTLLVLGPVGFTLGTYLTSAVLFLFAHVGWVAVGILSALLPFIIATGMHKALTPYVVNSVTTSGREFLMLPALLAHNLSESAACFAVAIRTKDSGLRSLAVSSGISAMFGITEPALYGITLQKKRVLISIMIACFIGGSALGLFAVGGSTVVSPSLASISMFVDPEDGSKILLAIAGLLISFVASFILTLILWKEESLPAASVPEPQPEPEPRSALPTVPAAVLSKTHDNAPSLIELKQPVPGTVIALSDVRDEVFSTGAMGPGIAVVPSRGELYAPADGTIQMVFRTQHALAMELDGGAELLFHIGIDTVKLHGAGFDCQVKSGDRVKAGDLLMTFDVESIVAAGYDPVALTILTNKERYTVREAEPKQAAQGILAFVTPVPATV